jgi:hypothetical protein
MKEKIQTKKKKKKKKTVTCQPVSSANKLLLLKTSEVRKRLLTLSLVTPKPWVWSRSLAGIPGSNHAMGIDVCPL